MKAAAQDSTPPTPPQLETVVKTKIIIVSDTHGLDFDLKPDPSGSAGDSSQAADVAIHCGDLTEESKIAEFETTIAAMKRLRAPLKLIIAGNHDFTLDMPVFKKKVEEANLQSERHLVERVYGDYGEARRLFEEAKDAGILLLDEGAHTFVLNNGAILRVYASPFTPSQSPDGGGFTFTSQEDHRYNVPENTNLVITHAPPHGIMDRTEDRQRAGSKALFKAVATVQPLIHCFGHIHEGWGAKFARWRDEVGDEPSHMTAIDNENSHTVLNLASFTASRNDDLDARQKKSDLATSHRSRGYCRVQHPGHAQSPAKGRETLFINAAMKDNEDAALHLPWLVEVELPLANLDAPSGGKIDDGLGVNDKLIPPRQDTKTAQKRQLTTSEETEEPILRIPKRTRTQEISDVPIEPFEDDNEDEK